MAGTIPGKFLIMQPPPKRWAIASRLTDQADHELSEYHPVLRQILFNRGYSTADAARQYVQALPPPGTDPENLSGMAQATDRIAYAIDHQEPIAVYGDYDADGVTGSALLVQALQRMGALVEGYIPDRFSEGYGLNVEALSALHETGIRLVITVDCGIRSIQEADHARSLGLDLIITDHHHPGNSIPEALSVINPKLPYDLYPEKDLAGVGLAYKLAEALFRQVHLPDTLIEEYLDLVALGTVTDLVPLLGENRSLVRAGLSHIHRPQRQGVLSLIGVSGLVPSQITAGDIAFMLGPRLNAAGRLDSALAAFNLLTTFQGCTSIQTITVVDATRFEAMADESAAAWAKSFLDPATGGTTGGTLAAAADKTGEFNVDKIVYLNSILGINLVVGTSADGTVDYSKNPVYFNFVNMNQYNRQYMFTHRGQVVAAPGGGSPATYDGTVRLLVQQTTPGTWVETDLPIFETVFGSTTSPNGEDFIGTDITGFTRMTDDDLRVIEYTHTYQIPGLR